MHHSLSESRQPEGHGPPAPVPDATLKRRISAALKRRDVRGGAIALGLSLALAACGSSSNSTSSTSSTSSAAAAGSSTSAASSAAKAPSGTPIKIGLINDDTGGNPMPFFKKPSQVGINQVNAAGGIGGHPVQLDECDDQSSVQTAQVCAQKLLVQDKVALIVGEDGLEDAAVMPTVLKAGTIEFATLGGSPADLTSPDVFIIEPAYVLYSLIPQLVTGSHKVAIFSAENAAAIEAAKKGQASYPKTDTTKVITVPLAATDFQAPCQQAKQMNADTAVVIFGAEQVPSMMQACTQLGVKMTWVIPGLGLTGATVKAVNQLHINSIIPTGYSETAYSDFYNAVAKYGPPVPDVSDYAIDSYMGEKLLPQLVQEAGALNSDGTINAAKLKTWLSQQTAFNTDGFTKPINFTAANQALGSAFPSVKNPCVYKASIVNGKVTVADPTPICLPAH